jgi:hypothetical protein
MINNPKPRPNGQFHPIGVNAPATKHEIVAYFQERLKRLTIAKTTSTPSGQTLDWIARESQHASGKIATPPPAGPAVLLPAGHTPARFELDVAGVERGPAGTVPVRRRDFSRIHATTSLAQYLSKPGGKRVNPSRPPADPDPFGYFHATNGQTVACYGCDGVLNMWDPYTETSADHTILQTGLQNYDKPQLQSLEAGWEVCHDQYGDWAPHLFTYYTTNGYSKDADNLGGYNHDVDGWVQYDSSIFPAALINGTSVLGGEQFTIAIKYQLYNSNWWFQVQGKWIGYYPASLYMGNQSVFSTLGDHASWVAFWGEVYSSNSDPKTTWTQMGSGQFAEAGADYAAFESNLRYQSDRGGGMTDMNGTGSAENTSLYDYQLHMKSGGSLGSYLLLGGPGAKQPQSSKHPCALAAFNGKLRAAFVANNNSDDLLICASPDGVNWTDNTPVSGQLSKTAPSLSAYKNKLWTAFLADNNSNDVLVCSSGDGLAWSGNTRINQSSRDAPSLAAFGNNLWIAFLANNSSNDVLVCSSTDGAHWTNNTRINQSSKAAPSLAVFDNKLWIAFIANNDSNDVLVCSSSDGLHWTNNTRINQSSKAAPSLAVFENKLWISFIANNNSNDVLVCSSSDGLNWTNNTRINQSSKAAPALAVFGNKLWVLFLANNSTNSVLLCSSSNGQAWSGNIII